MSDVELERLVSAALRRDVPTDVRARARIMERVREEARRSSRPRPWYLVRGVRHSVVGVALAAGIGSITAMSALLPSGGTAGGPNAVVIGDTVASTLRDTLRLVRLMFDAPGARQVAVVGDFNGYAADESPLVRDAASRRWSATLALRDGVHRYAFVVDGTRWVTDPSAERVRGNDGRLYSLLRVARATN
jgi:hypothetical protein